MSLLLKEAGGAQAAHGYRPYRHACASILLAQGVPARVVMEILGHSDIRLTLNTYTHVVPALGREAAERMDAVLAPAERPSGLVATSVATVGAGEG